MKEKILYIKSKWLDDEILDSRVKVKKRLLPWDKYFYDFMFVKAKNKDKLIKKREDKYRFFENGMESNFNLYLKLNKERLRNKDFTIKQRLLGCIYLYIFRY